MNNETKLYVGVTALTIILAIVIACRKISQPGLYYDELLFVNGALAGKGDIFIRYRFHGIPILLMDYIGALKAWIYFPIFSIFPVNSWSVRLPSILIGITGGVLLVMALRRGFGPVAGITGAIMILLDPTLITHSRLDWGPNALMFFFRGLLFFSFVRWTRTSNPKWAWVFVIAIGLGIFDKLNFIWIGCAAIAATLIFYRQQLKEFVRAYPRHARLLFSVTAIGLGASIVRAIMVSENIDIAWGNRIGYAFSLIRYILCGGGALEFISGNGIQLAQWIWPGYLFVVIAACWGVASILINNNSRRLFFWSFTFLTLVALAFIITKTATGPHHASVLGGIWQFVLAALLGIAWQSKIQYDRLFRILTVLACVLVTAGYIKANAICTDAFAKPVNMNWDAASTNAALFAKQHTDADFIAADWGLGLHLIAVTKDQPIILDVWTMFMNTMQTEEVITNIRKDRYTYIYTHSTQFEAAKGNRANLIAALKKFHINGEIFKTYTNREGKVFVEIWRIPPINK